MQTSQDQCSCVLDIDNIQSIQDTYFNVRDADYVEDDYDSYNESSSNEDEENDDHESDQNSLLDFNEVDMLEQDRVKSFFEASCGCTLIEGQPCSKTISKEDFNDCRWQCTELTSAELDLVILGCIHTCLNNDETSTSGREGKSRKRTRMTFYYHNKRICLNTYLFMHRLHKTRFYSLVKHYKKNGLTLREHGNKRRLPSSTFSAETIERVVRFLLNTAEQQALILPGRVPGFKRTDVKLLPSCLSKVKLWKLYQDSSTAEGKTAVGYSKFCDLWSQLCPFIIIMKPASDLCWTCQKNNNKIHRSANLPETEKAETVKQQERHLQLAMGEREFYQACCKDSKDILKETLYNIDLNESREPCSFAGRAHYSYDYAQQLHYPSDPYQPGPIYFKTPRKCALFGVCCEGIPRQVNFLIDESVQTGKGANSTISYVHYFFEKHGMGEIEAIIHADNCSGQNKNNAFLWYYLWRVMTGCHHKIEYNFLIAGHTKFAPDWCFGLLKQKTRKNFISSLFDIARCVEESSDVNNAELVGLHNGTVCVQTYDWTLYLQDYFKKLPRLKSYHHFRFDKNNPGTVFCKEYCNSDEIAVNLLKNQSTTPQPGILPNVIMPSGLSRERSDYLYNEIREFCREGTEDLVAPKVV